MIMKHKKIIMPVSISSLSALVDVPMNLVNGERLVQTRGVANVCRI